MKRPYRCLVSEMPDEAELAEAIRERIAAMDDEERTPDEEYAFRLSRCRACAFLQRGTCVQCGCYAELRAAKRRMGCPAVPAKW